MLIIIAPQETDIHVPLGGIAGNTEDFADKVMKFMVELCFDVWLDDLAS